MPVHVVDHGFASIDHKIRVAVSSKGEIIGKLAIRRI